MAWGGPRPGAGRKKQKGDQPRSSVVVPIKPLAAAPVPVAADKKPMKVSVETAARARARARLPKTDPSLVRAGEHTLEDAKARFFPQQPPPGTAKKNQLIAMDDNSLIAQTLSWSAQAVFQGGYWEGTSCLPYAYLAQLAQIAEYRRPVEVIAEQMTRKWIKLKAKGGDDAVDKTDAINRLNDALLKFKVQDRFRELAEQDGFFGRSHLYIDTGATDNRDELKTPIGAGADAASRAKLGKGFLKALKTIEPVWCYPTAYNSNDPLRPDWYNPQAWLVQGKQIHSSRLLRFVAREVPDLLKPAYSFGGLALTQMGRDTVNNWLRSRQSVSDITNNFSVNGLKTNLSGSLQPTADGSDIFTRMDMFDAFRDNSGTMVLDKETEEFFNVAAPLGTLDALQAQAQEHMAAVWGIPLVYLLGISPHGLNASSEGEIRVFEDNIAALQERFFRPNLTTVLNLIQVSEFGAVDPDIVFDFEPLHTMSEKEEAEIGKMKAETHDLYVNGIGAVSPEEVRKSITADPDSPYHSLDPDDMPEPPEDLMGGEMGGGENVDLTGKQKPPQPEEVGEDTVIPFGLASDAAEFKEGDHPRAPDGKFGSGGGSGGKNKSEGSEKNGNALDPKSIKQVGPQMGSNPGGTFQDGEGKRYYVKQGKTKAHVANELAAANLYALTGGSTLNYVPVKGGGHIATEMAKLDKNNANKFSPAEIKAAQEDFVAHAWLANYDAAGTGGDNLGVIGGKVVPLDFGGALEYRAQGAPKGDKFGEKVGEIDSLRDSNINRDTAKVYGSMTDEDLAKSAAKVTALPDDAILKAVAEVGAPEAVARKLIARRDHIAKRFGIALDEFNPADHPHAPAGSPEGGQFTSTGGGGGGSPSTFKSKKEHVAHLLKNGTTAAEILKATGWPSVSVPQQAMAAGMKLEKFKEGGVTKYKGTPMTPQELAEAKTAQKAKAVKAGAEINPPSPAVQKVLAPAALKTIPGPAGSSMEASIHASADGKSFNVVYKDVDSGETLPTVHIAPTLMGAEKIANKSLYGEKGVPPAMKPVVPQATPDELKKAKKATTLPLSSTDPEAVEAIKAFNAKYSGKEISDPDALNQKVADYKEVAAKIAEGQKKTQAEQLKAQAAAQQKQIDAAKKEAEAYAAKFDTPEAKEHFETLSGIMSGSKGAKNALAAAESKIAQLGLKMTPTECAMIMAYSGSHYREVNAQLRAGVITETQYKFTKALNTALDKLPAYTKTTYRKASLTAAQASQYKPGFIVPERAFTSSAKNEGVWSGSHHYVIEGSGGRDISKISHYPGESEVLFKANSHFMVTKVVGNQIHLKEMD